jgi:hypothetical protein
MENDYLYPQVLSLWCEELDDEQVSLFQQLQGVDALCNGSGGNCSGCSGNCNCGGNCGL